MLAVFAETDDDTHTHIQIQCSN